MKCINLWRYDTPEQLPTLMLGEMDGEIIFIHWLDKDVQPDLPGRWLTRYGVVQWVERLTPSIKGAVAQLDEYFEGARTMFSIPLRLVGTRFQRSVWDALLQIPYGRTVSYSSLAVAVGRPSAVRAVANAVGANPVAVMVPCHRVIAADGSIGGYAGGLPAKRFLLKRELLPGV